MSRQFPLPLPHQVAMAAEDFLPGSSNVEAVVWIERWPNWPTLCLAICGPSGSGKTHLLQIWQARSSGLLLNAAHLAQNDIDQLVAAHHLAIDDADQLAGDAASEEKLFHLYNRLKEAGGSLLLASRLPPAQWQVKLPDLHSRLATAVVAALTEPDDQLMTALIVKQFRDRQLDITGEVIAYLLPRIERSAASIKRMVADLDRLSLSENRGVTIALARQWLAQQDNS